MPNRTKVKLPKWDKCGEIQGSDGESEGKMQKYAQMNAAKLIQNTDVTDTLKAKS